MGDRAERCRNPGVYKSGDSGNGALRVGRAVCWDWLSPYYRSELGIVHSPDLSSACPCKEHTCLQGPGTILFAGTLEAGAGEFAIGRNGGPRS